MLKNISWTDYITAIAIIVTLYYLYVGIRYYSVELKEIISGKRKIKIAFRKTDRSAVHFPEDETDNDGHDPYEDDDDEFADVESLIGNIKELIINSKGSDLTSTSFRQDLHQVLDKYPSVKNSPFRASINELIVSECEKRSAVTLGESAVDKLWEEAR